MPTPKPTALSSQQSPAAEAADARASGPCAGALDDMICFDIYSANLAVGRIYKPLLDGLGLTYPQYLVLMILWRHDGVSLGEIGAVLGLESSTLTPLVKRLEAAGFVTRRRSEEDERRVLIELTEKGRAVQGEEARIRSCVFGAAGLELEEITQLQRLLRKLSGAIRESLD
ncbi:MAG: MarR family transcriptional regulator [Maritimibacter sp.]